MSKLDTALKRLDLAVHGLEDSIGTMSGDALSDDSGPGDSGKAGVLARDLEALRRDYAHLGETTAAAGEKLDTAIGKLKLILDR